MRPLLALGLLALLTASLAGCAGDPERYPDGVGSNDGQTTADGGTTAPATGTSTSTTTGGPANQAPTGSISVAINGTNATFTLSGSDPDGDAIVWDLDFGDGNATNGTQLPQTLNHTYASGNFTANFTVSDGQESVSHDVTVALGGGKPPIVLAGSYTAADPVEQAMPGFGCLFGGEPAPGAGEPFGNVVAVPPEAIGGAYTAESSSPSYFYFEDADFAVLNDGAATGTVPEGTTDLWVCASEPTSANVSWTMSIVPV